MMNSHVFFICFSFFFQPTVLRQPHLQSRISRTFTTAAVPHGRVPSSLTHGLPHRRVSSSLSAPRRCRTWTCRCARGAGGRRGILRRPARKTSRRFSSSQGDAWLLIGCLIDTPAALPSHILQLGWRQYMEAWSGAWWFRGGGKKKKTEPVVKIEFPGAQFGLCDEISE